MEEKREAEYTHDGIYPPGEGIGQRSNPRLSRNYNTEFVGYSDGNGGAKVRRGVPTWAWILGLVLLGLILAETTYVLMFVLDLQEGLRKIGDSFSDLGPVPTLEPFPS